MYLLLLQGFAPEIVSLNCPEISLYVRPNRSLGKISESSDLEYLLFTIDQLR